MITRQSNTIKAIVRKNFDKSANLYDQFEQKYGLFNYLTTKLADLCKLQKGMKVCDVGCGTGTSSFVLQKIVDNNGLVIGIDSSEKMLGIAQARLEKEDLPNIKFLLCDANEFNMHIDHKLDSVMYNATIFLVPEPERTLKTAYDILVKKGTVGMNYLIGIYEIDALENQNADNDLFFRVKEAGEKYAPYGRRIIDVAVLPDILDDLGFRNIHKGILSKKMNSDELKAFYGIPAQSAGLWPKNYYEERLKLLDLNIEYFLKQNISTYYQYWGWIVAEV